MHLRYTVSALLVFALALSASLTRQAGAQTPCVDGQAGEFACDSIDLIANIPVSELTDDPVARGNDMWGWADPDTGNEYAIIGLTNGTVFIDVSVPTAPVILGTLPTEDTAPTNCTWRDMKVYADHVFIVADCFTHGMQVFDLTRLRDVSDPPETFDTDAYYSGINSAHNIVINPEAGLAFPVGSNVCSGGLEILDISDPLNPSHIGCFDDHQYVHDAQCVRYTGPDTDHAGDDICFNASAPSFGSSNRFLSIVDVTDPANPSSINFVEYPNDAYTHQGWLTDDQSTFILDDELTSSIGGTKTFYFDVSDLETADFLYMKQGTTDAGAHNLYVRDGIMYQSNYEGGLRIWDVRTPETTESVDEIAYFDTYPSGDNAGSFDGTWSNYPYFESGVVVVNDRDNGVFVLQPTSLPTDTTPGPTPPDQLVVRLTGPNPAGDQTSISINAPTDQEITVDVIDAEGRVLQTVGSPFARAGWETTVSVNVHDLPAGTYFLRVQGEQETVTKRIAVVR